MATSINKLTKIVHTKGKRVGRGYSSGKGKTSGRGQTGQRARNHVSPGFEGGQTKFVIRLPFLRGKQFRTYAIKPTSLNLAQIDAHYTASESITIASLKEKDLISNRVKKVKFLGYGELTKALTFEDAFIYSAQAIAKIEKAGGSVKKVTVTETVEENQSPEAK